MGGRYNKETNNFQSGRRNLERSNRQNFPFQKRNKQRREAIDTRAAVIANSKVEDRVSAFKVETFNPQIQAYIRDLEQKYNLESPESYPSRTEAIISETLFEEMPKSVKTFIKKAAFFPDLIQKVQTVVKKAAPKGEKTTFAWVNNLVKELKAANITVTETFMDRLLDFLANNKVLKPLTAAMVMITLALTSCKPIEASNTNEAPAAATAQITGEENKNTTNTSVAPVEEETPATNPGDPTEEAKLSAAQLEDEIEQAGKAANIEVITSSSFAEKLYKLDYISPSTNKDILINESTGRPYVRLNNASPYGPAGTLITEDIGGRTLFISGKVNNLTDIRVEGAYIAMGTAEDGTNWVVNPDGSWVTQSEGRPEQAVAEIELSAAERASYTATIEKYISGNNVEQILNMMPEAQAILAGGEYNESLSNTERQVLAFAIVAELENQREIQPLFFENEGTTYYYNPTIENVNNRWQTSDESNEQIEQSTIQLYTPIYIDKNTKNIMYFWEGQWKEAHNSNSIDYSTAINSDNRDNGVIDFTSENMLNFTEILNLSYIPMIVIDDSVNELELFPVSKGKINDSGVVLYNRADVLMLNKEKSYAINVKLMIAGEIRVYYPNTQDDQVISAVQSRVENLENVFSEGNTYFMGLSPDHLNILQTTIYSTPLINNTENTDEYLSNRTAFWEKVKKTGFVSAYPVFIYDGN